MKGVWYFAYGSNMNPERMKERGVNFKIRKKAFLKCWKLVFNKTSTKNPKEGFANIVFDGSSIMEGILYLINEEDIRKLDKYEGYPDHYGRIRVRVLTLDGAVEAEVYVAQSDKTAPHLKPPKWYMDHLLKGCDLLSESYCAMLRSIKTLD
ncbi:MAG: gamma-glutamylcyclotransferase [Candidatus Nanohaloarchaeota archaeon]|nr:gamma-glutamylcyclotransferase [Candidatus Nanohaloarchaeota archaeon]